MAAAAAKTGRRARLGQHFLEDVGVARRAVAAIAPGPDDTLVEIGPGRGALTEPLLAAAGTLDAVELDRELARGLESWPGLRVHIGDALRFPFETLARDGRRLRIAGNLPYYLSTPLLFRLFEQAHCIDDMHFMLQREVVERMVAPAGDAAYGRLSVMVRCHADATALFEVPPEAFRPPPRVHSAFVRLSVHRRPLPEGADPATFAQLVTRAFSQRRKRLGNALRGFVDADAMRAAGVDPERRPGTLEFEEFAALAATVPPPSEVDAQ